MTKRLVIKVGSNVLTRSDGMLDTTIVSSLVDQIVFLRKEGYEVVLVSSGAVACGRTLVSPHDALDEVQQRQLYSALGQVKLMNLYARLFGDWQVQVGQVLTQKQNFEAGEAYSNQKSCMEVMLHCGVVPIVNENDTVSITELMFTDNDQLAGLISKMVSAQTLVILSNIDGLYDDVPSAEGSSVIRRVLPGEDISKYIKSSNSKYGRGGMSSKGSVASTLAAGGIRVLIANGKRPNILMDLHTDPDNTVHTEFVPTNE